MVRRGVRTRGKGQVRQCRRRTRPPSGHDRRAGVGNAAEGADAGEAALGNDQSVKRGGGGGDDDVGGDDADDMQLDGDGAAAKVKPLTRGAGIRPWPRHRPAPS